MKSRSLSIFVSTVAAISLLTPALYAVAVPGQPAPAFTLTASDGKTYSLSDYKGKFVVLEWFNKDCPFIRKQYDSGNMQKLQQTYRDKGVV